MSRLFLITPRQIDLSTFPAELEAALGAGDVASLLIAPDGVSDMVLQRIAEVLTPIGQARGAAVMVRDDTRAAGRAKADGVHVETGSADLRAACLSFQPNRIVGAGALKTRDDAMAAGETGADYVFFGMLGAAETPEPHPRSLDLTDWWVPLFEVPCVCLAGSNLASVDTVAATGADFVALRDAVWTDPRGPAAAVAEASARLEAAAAEA